MTYQLQGLKEKGWEHQWIQGDENCQDMHVWTLARSPTHTLMIFSQSSKLFFWVGSVQFIDWQVSTALHPQTLRECTATTSIEDAERLALTCAWDRIHLESKSECEKAVR